MKKKTIICEQYENDGKTYLKDYRLKKDVEFIKGKLSDLQEWYCKSVGLSDLVSCCGQFINDVDDNFTIVEYSKKYALGIKKED